MGEMVGLEFGWPLQRPWEALSDSQVLPLCFKINFWVGKNFHQISGCSTNYNIFLFDAKWSNFKNSFKACWKLFPLQTIYYNVLGQSTQVGFIGYPPFLRLQGSWPAIAGHHSELQQGSCDKKPWGCFGTRITLMKCRKCLAYQPCSLQSTFLHFTVLIMR